jgi:two-component system CheB/CheR fusion protein
MTGDHEALDPKLEELLEYLKRTRGFDFTAYKRSTLGRRIDKRIQSLNLDGYARYLDFLQVHPGEFAFLFNTILINVTEFFRDPPAWEYLAAEALPRILQSKRPRAPIRIWSAGCASGEEAYSIAMLLGEALGRDGLLERVKLYATDVDEEALAAARQGRYREKTLENVPRPLLEKYFVRDGDAWVFDKDARRAVIFGRHDLVQDPPISRVDLLVCRNTLMYFNTDTQGRVLARFHFALNEPGYLFVGRAEMPLTRAELFAPAELRRRFFFKVRRGTMQDHLNLLALANNTEGKETRARAPAVADIAFDLNPAAQIVLDGDGQLALANERARTLLRLGGGGRPRHFRDLDLPLEVLRRIEEIYAEPLPGRLNASQLAEVEWVTSSGARAFYQVTVKPMRDAAGNLLGTTLVLEDISALRDLQEQLQRSRQELETVSEELQSSNEELETTNEELQSTVEELETTNEELQSTNEELETMNEELQSTNEELHTMNDELRQRSEEVGGLNAFLASVLAGIEAALVVLDREARVKAWNPAAEDLWGLRGAEVEQKSFFGLDIGLPVGELGPAVQAALGGEARRVTLHATNRRGRPITCEVRCGPLGSPKTRIEGVVMTMQAHEAAP